MDDKRVLDKLDKLDERLDKIDITLIKQQAILDEHVRRSLSNEETLDLYRKEFEPVKQHVLYVNFVFKIFLFLATLAAFGESIKNLF